MACFWRSLDALAAVLLAILRSSRRVCFSCSSFARGRTYRFNGRVVAGDVWIVDSAVVVTGSDCCGATVCGIVVEWRTGGHIVPP